MSAMNDAADPVIKEIWQRFINNRETPEDIEKLDPVICQSWVRSRNLQVDPYEIKSQILEKNQLQKHLSDSRLLITVAASYIEKLSSFLEGELFSVVLVDADGIILNVAEGTGKTMEQEKTRTHMEIGANRNESYVGTTASGTCMLVDKPLMIRGAEHFIEAHHGFCSSAAPIHFNGRIIGSIGIVGSLEAHYHHTLGMMVAAADGIEKEFKLRSAYYRVQLTNSQLESTFQSISSGIMMLDNNGRIVHMNDRICKILSMTDNDLSGKKLEEIISLDGLEIPLHMIDENMYSREVSLILPNRRTQPVLLTACMILNPKGVRHGVVLTFDIPKQVNRLVSRLSGFAARYTFDSIIGSSPQAENAKYLAKVAAGTNSSVLILGESGTGKELFAQAIHNASDRAKYPFIAINCASLPAELVESELFGYVGGAFTGASKEGQPGKFELADNGTLFLDEIGDMPFGIQATLLRVLQMGETIRIGGKNPIPVNVRIIAATNQNLEQAIAANTFRQDLYYRLNVFPIHLPPLRERKNDIRPLLEYFLKTYKGKDAGPEAVSDEAMTLLEQYDWPGNVREMQNVVERAVILSQGRQITTAQLPEEIVYPNLSLRRSTAAPPPAEAVSQTEPSYSSHIGRISSLEKEMVVSTLRETGGNVSHAAHLLGISRQTMYCKIRQFKLDPSEFRFQY